MRYSASVLEWETMF
jgi:hypothetical protein